jgi:hypothetical protein
MRLLGVGLIAGLIALVMSPSVEPSALDRHVQAQAPRVASFASLPATDSQAVRSILARSPFARDRAAFDREAAVMPPAAPIDVRLTGVFRMGKAYQASLVIGGQSFLVKQGDETPAGRIQKIEASAVILDGSPERRIEMFKQ